MRERPSRRTSCAKKRAPPSARGQGAKLEAPHDLREPLGRSDDQTSIWKTKAIRRRSRESRRGTVTAPVLARPVSARGERPARRFGRRGSCRLARGRRAGEVEFDGHPWSSGVEPTRSRRGPGRQTRRSSEPRDAVAREALKALSSASADLGSGPLALASPSGAQVDRTHEEYDRGEKLESYQRIPSLDALVLVSHREQLARRSPDLEESRGLKRAPHGTDRRYRRPAILP